MKMRHCVIGVGLVAACATAGRPVPGTGGAVAAARDSTPPRLVPDKHFVPPYSVPLRRVGATGNVDVSAVVLPSGAIDTSTVRIVAATFQALTPGVRESFANLRISPAHVAGRPVAGTLTLRITFRLVNCDTIGDARRTTWDADSTPPTITIWQCYRPLMWTDMNWPKQGHVTLSGLFTQGGWEGGESFTVCEGQKLPMRTQLSAKRGLTLDRRTKVDWTPLRAVNPTPREGDRFYVRWEGDIYGPPASEHLGIGSYHLLVSRIIEAARWSDKSCAAPSNGRLLRPAAQ